MVNVGLDHFLQNGCPYWSCVYNEDHGSVLNKETLWAGYLYKV